MKYSKEELNELRRELADRRLITKLEEAGLKPVFENPYDFLNRDKEDYEVLIVTQRAMETKRVTLADESYNRTSVYIAEPAILKEIEDETISVDLDGVTVAKIAENYAVIEFISVTVPTTYTVDKLYDGIIASIKNVKEEGVKGARRQIAKRKLKEKLEKGLINEIKEVSESYKKTLERQESLMSQLTDMVKKRDVYSQKLKLLQEKKDVSVDKLLKDLDETDILKSYEITELGYRFEFKYTDITDLEGNKYKGTEYTVNISDDGRIRFSCPEEDKKECYWSGGPTCHPHIDADGGACFGEIGSSISIAIAEADLVSAVYMLYAYLGSANETDMAGEYIDKWELVELSPAAEQRKIDYEEKVRQVAHAIAEDYQSDKVKELEQYLFDTIEVSDLYKINRYPAADEVERVVGYLDEGIEEIVGHKDEDSHQEEDEEELRCINCGYKLESYFDAVNNGVVDGDRIFCSIDCYREWEEL